MLEAYLPPAVGAGEASSVSEEMQHTSEGACVVAAEGSKIVGRKKEALKNRNPCGCVRPFQIVDGPEVFNVLVCNGGSEGLPNGIKEVNWWYTLGVNS